MLPDLHIAVTNDVQHPQVMQVLEGLFAYEQQKAGSKVQRHENAHHLVLRDEQHSVYGGISCVIRWDGLWINNFLVKEEYRGRGLGKKLLDHAHTVAREQKCRFLFVETLSFHNIQFYLRNGFEQMLKMENYPEGFDYYLFRRTV